MLTRLTLFSTAFWACLGFFAQFSPLLLLLVLVIVAAFVVFSVLVIFSRHKNTQTLINLWLGLVIGVALCLLFPMITQWLQ